MHNLGKIDFQNLLLDPLNPRLPENVQNSSQPDLLRYLYDHEVLDELALSYVQNGFFENEYLITLPEQDGKRIVAEGNRRLAALKYLVHDSDAEDAGIPEFESGERVTSRRLEELAKIPAMEVESRESLSAYLGFRHISGLRTWPAASKARFVNAQVEREARLGSENPFKTVGKNIGSNALGVRNLFLSYNLLIRARDEGVTPKLVNWVLEHKFTVWMRLLFAEGIPEFIGLESTAMTFDDFQNRLGRIKYHRIGRLLQDLVSGEDGGKAVIRDSRQVSNYARVLADPHAFSVLEETGSLELAGAFLEKNGVGRELRKVLDALDGVSHLIDGNASLTKEDGELITQVVQKSRKIRAVINEFIEPDSEE